MRWLALFLMMPLLISCGTEREIRVAAPRTLSTVLPAIAQEFEERNQGVNVDLAFYEVTPTQAELTAAETDVLLSDDRHLMEDLGAALASSPDPFTSTLIDLVVPSSNPEHISSAEDLSPGVRWAACVPSSGCGAATRKVLHKIRFQENPTVTARDSRGVLSLVRSGQASAGFVYSSDTEGAGTSIQRLPSRSAAVGVLFYSATLRQAPEGQLAAQFFQYLNSARAERTFLRAGFYRFYFGE